MKKHLKPRAKPARGPRPTPWGQRVARQNELGKRGVCYACRIIPCLDGFEAVVTVPGEPEHAPDRRGMAATPADAIVRALGRPGLTFASELDEQDVCLAALRGRVVRLERDERRLTSLGLL